MGKPVGDMPETFSEKGLLLEFGFQSDVLFSFIPNHAFVHLFSHSLAKQINGVCHCLYAA